MESYYIIAGSSPLLAVALGVAEIGQNPSALVNGLNSNIATGGQPTVRLSGPSSPFSVGGFQLPGAATPQAGQQLAILNTTSQPMTLVHEDASSAATSRISTGSTGPVTLLPSPRAIAFVFDGTLLRWALVNAGLQNLRDINVRDMGAYGDGVHDDSTALDAATALAATVNGKVYLPAGTYMRTTQWAVPCNVSVEGAGKLSTSVLFTTAALNPCMLYSSVTYETEAGSLSDFAIVGQLNAGSPIVYQGLKVWNTLRARVERLLVKQCATEGISFFSTTLTHFDQCVVTACGQAGHAMVDIDGLSPTLPSVIGLSTNFKYGNNQIVGGNYEADGVYVNRTSILSHSGGGSIEQVAYPLRIGNKAESTWGCSNITFRELDHEAPNANGAWPATADCWADVGAGWTGVAPASEVALGGCSFITFSGCTFYPPAGVLPHGIKFKNCYAPRVERCIIDSTGTTPSDAVFFDYTCVHPTCGINTSDSGTGAGANPYVAIGQSLGPTASVTNGSATVTLSIAQSLLAGTTLVFGSQPNTGYLVLTTTVNSTSVTLASNYTGVTSSLTTVAGVGLVGITASVSVGAGTAVTLSAAATVPAGASLTFSSQPSVVYTASATTTGTSVTLTSAYTGTTSTTAALTMSVIAQDATWGQAWALAEGQVPLIATPPSITTTDATTTAIYTEPPQASASTYDYLLTVVGQEPSTGDMYRANFAFTYQRIGTAAPTLVGSVSILPLNVRSTTGGAAWGTGGAVATFALVGTSLQVSVQGKASTTIDWSVQFARAQVS